MTEEPKTQESRIDPRLDSRRTPARPDLAAAHLKGEVEAGRYAEATLLAVSTPLAPMTTRPDGEASLANQLLHGERFSTYEQDDEWAWGQAEHDGYVGYVPRICLMPPGPAPTHRVTRPLTHVYPSPALKTRPIGWLSYGALVRVEGTEAGFAALSTGGFVPTPHLSPRAFKAPDWVAEAERFLGAPYLWGGRASTGLDCSALVQLALQAAGRDCPRDSDMQEAELGRTLSQDAVPERGNLIFWKGHVGIMLDQTRLLHANGHHVAVGIEALDTARTRIQAAEDGPVTRHARLDATVGDG
jgi:cell wall-associated NlpC family hydrolase